MNNRVISKEACPRCKETGGDWDDNNLVVYANGGSFCFACKYTKPNNQVSTPQLTTNSSINLAGEYKELFHRKISEKTCRENNYMVAKFGNQDVEIANYIEDGIDQIAQKIRLPNKQFQWENRNGRTLHMYGLNNKLDFTKPLIITEGEIDKLSCNEIGWQAVSVIDGASSIDRNIKFDYDTLVKFKEIILFLDNPEMDKEGAKALKTACELLPIEKIRIVKDYFGQKDANDLLKVGLLQKVLSNNVEEFTPDGVVFGNTLKKDKLLEKRPVGLELPWPEVTKLIRGLRQGKLILLGAGSNIGKSPVLREIGYHLRTTYPNLKIANIYLEEDQNDSPLSYLAMEHGIPSSDFIEDPLKYISKKQFDDSYERLINTNKLMFTNIQYDLDSKALLSTLEYLGKIKKYDVVLLDHISMVIAASESKEGERRDIDILMKNLRSIIRKTGLIVIAACHLSNPEGGKDWEDGREIRQRDFRGSGSLRQIPDILLGVERNMRDPYQKDKSILRVVKNRGYGSDVGVADELHYNTQSGRLQTLNDIFGGVKDE